MKVTLIHDSTNPHHSVRLINGLSLCGHEVDILDSSSKNFDPSNLEKREWVFVESSVDKDLSSLDNLFDNIIFFDVEDKPTWQSFKLGYQSIKNKILAYGKYNYQPQAPNPDGIKHIALPQSDYIHKGSALAKAIKNVSVPLDLDIFFAGAPTYMTDYHPSDKIKHIDTNDLKTVVVRPDAAGRPSNESIYLYHQRLEWIELVSRTNLRATTGLHFIKDPTRQHCLSIEFQVDLFGKNCEQHVGPTYDSNSYYTNFLRAPIGLSPSGVARSSYRIIELMALGRIIISTNMQNYKYLYNPVSSIEIEDGTRDLIKVIDSCLSNKDSLLKSAEENMAIFYELTPDKMWKDFVKQI